MTKAITTILLVFLLFGCTRKEENINLVPREPGTASNYWCTWYWQNYLILKGQEVTNPDAGTVYTNPAAREHMTEKNIFGENGMASIMLPKTRSDYYFVIDHGWQDKSIPENTFFTLIMDTLDFPRYAHLSPKERINQMNIDIKALGLLVAVKRHPMKTPRMYNGKDFHLQISGERHVDKRLNEMDRLALWQRIAPPMPAGYGTYQFSKHNLVDSIVFQESDTWFKPTHGKIVRQSAPAIMARNIVLPEVYHKELAPYVMASKFPNGAIAIATEGRVTPNQSWIHPNADIKLKDVEINKPIGIFGHYESLTLQFAQNLPQGISIYAQDLLSKKAIDITQKVAIDDKRIKIAGHLIDEIGTMENDTNDISVPGMVIKIISYND